jgi:hypothetical protein
VDSRLENAEEMILARSQAESRGEVRLTFLSARGAALDLRLSDLTGTYAASASSSVASAPSGMFPPSSEIPGQPLH